MSELLFSFPIYCVFFSTRSQQTSSGDIHWIWQRVYWIRAAYSWLIWINGLFIVATKLQKKARKRLHLSDKADVSSFISDMCNQMEHQPPQETPQQLLRLEIPSHSALPLRVNIQLLHRSLSAFTFGPPPPAPRFLGAKGGGELPGVLAL